MLLGLLATLIVSKPAAGDWKGYITPIITLSEEIYPCTRCHDNVPVNKKKRELKVNHSGIVLKHGEAKLWCMDCHDADNRDKLKLLNKELADFDKSNDQCGQCHGKELLSWEAGITGKRTGMWNGEKLYRPCVQCHDPHVPHRITTIPVVPETAPLRPLEIRLKTK